MDKNSTQTSAVIEFNKDGYSNSLNPKKSTINFLKQFARAYSYEPKLNGALGNFIAN